MPVAELTQKCPDEQYNRQMNLFNEFCKWSLCLENKSFVSFLQIESALLTKMCFLSAMLIKHLMRLIQQADIKTIKSPSLQSVA
jgi:hypothetical protein